MRALLIVNPAATTTSEATREVISAALARDVKLDVAVTASRGHARELAARAAADDLDVVVALGGDGTVNEVVNGLLAVPGMSRVPALGVVPGGHTNVMARSLGLPRDPVDATATLLEALRLGRRRRISLGRADDRWFTFCAGLGFDAEVVARVEGRRRRGVRASGARYVGATIQQYVRAAGQRAAPLTLAVPGQSPVAVRVALVTNTAPWTYLGTRTVDPSPQASFETGLDVYALTEWALPTTVAQVRRILAGRAHPPRGRHVVGHHDVDEVVLRATDAPLAFQVDGEHLGVRSQVVLHAVRDALWVVA